MRPFPAQVDRVVYVSRKVCYSNDPDDTQSSVQQDILNSSNEHTKDYRGIVSALIMIVISLLDQSQTGYSADMQSG